ncbi:hypothetical protein [Nocardia blacklockiae]|uniref:hypothetical protein n=1 Tax=Nocardia blacklockiae TaxID=480036 RepID=UPI001893A9B4|nr:hypothetical protein [Nocardia blacklockiae]MBF6170014.1 hypothetical protein [Nocardia blacklockiae]
MRTAVVRIDVDPAGELSVARLTQGVAVLREGAGALGAEVLDNYVAGRPPHRREVQLLVGTADPEATVGAAVRLCAEAFGTEPVPGVLTYVSRGTDDDAHGVLAGFGLSGEVAREPGPDGFDIVHVTLPEAALARVPESRVHTALEASLNCEVRIRTR